MPSIIRSRGAAPRRAAVSSTNQGASRALPPLRPVALACVLAWMAPGALACNASDTASLLACIQGAGTDPTINITQNITLTANIGALASGVTINGGGFTIDGAGTYSGFSVDAGTASVRNLTVTNMLASGIAVTDSATLVLGAPNTYSGTVSLHGGRLLSTDTTGIGNDFLFDAGSNTLAAATGTTATYTGDIDVNPGGSFVVGDNDNKGTVVLNAADVLRASNIASLRVSGGTLRGSALSTLTANADSTTVDSGATLDLGGNFAVINGLQGEGRIVNPAMLAAITSGNFAGQVTGGTNLLKTGPGDLILSGGNDYSGATYVQGGTLRAGAANALSANSAFVVDGGGVLDLNGFGQTIGSLAGAGAVTLSNAQLVAGGDNSDTVFSGTISGGSGSLVKAGTGTMWLSGSNTYGGGTIVDAGVLGIQNTAALGAGAVTVNNGRLRVDADGILSNDLRFTGTGAGLSAMAGRSIRLTGDIDLASGGAVTFGSATDTGTIVVDAANATAAASSAVRVAGGTLQAAGGNNRLSTLTSGASTVQVDAGATLDFNGNAGSVRHLTGAGVLRNDGATIEVLAGDFGGDITGTAGLFKSGTGTLVLSGASAYSGSTSVAQGTLRAGASNAFSASSAFSVASGATMDLNGHDQAIGSLAGDGVVMLGGATLTTIANGIGTTFSGSITGGGIVIKGGSSTWTLSGTNNFSGGLVVGGGTVAAPAGASLGTGQITLSNGGLRLLDDATVANAISTVGGTGAISVDAGKNASFTGTLAVGSGSTLRLGDASANGTLVLGLASSTWGTGAGVNVHLAGGEVRLLNAALSGVGTGLGASNVTTTIDAGAMLDFNDNAGFVNDLHGTGTVRTGTGGANVVTVNGGSFAGGIQGAGGLAKAGAGTLVLSGSGRNTYAGSTTLAGGTLEAGAANVLSAASAHQLAAGTTLRLNNFDQTVGSIAGSGAIDLGSARLTAGGNHQTTLYDGAITGTGGLTKTGTGTLILAGNNGYTGPTTVNAGTLTVNGSVTSAITVGAGGTLGGTGTVRNVTVANGGVLAPGNSIGTLTANGNLHFAPGSIYRVEANAAGAADRVNSVGAGTITIAGGTVDVQAGGGGYQRNTRYTILSSAGATTGRFDGVTTNLAFLTPSLVYEANAVLLNLQSGDATDYSSVAHTVNQRNVASYLNGFANQPGSAAALIQQIDNLSAEQARRAFDALSGSPHASASQVAAAVGRNFSASLAARTGFSVGGLGNAMTDWSRTHYASVSRWADEPGAVSDIDLAQAGPARGVESSLPGDGDRGFWVQTLGAGGRLDDDGNGPSLRYGSSGFVFGMDQPVGGRWLAGAAVGYSRSHWDADIRGALPASGKLESPQAGLYARYAGDGWRLRLDATYVGHRFKTDRNVVVGAINTTASSTHRGRELGLGAQAEFAMAWGAWQLKPLAGVRHARLREDGFTESGGGDTSLSVGARTMQSTVASAGMHFTRLFAGGRGGLELRTVASHLFGDADSPVIARLAGQATSFVAYGTPLERNALTLGATLTGAFSRGVSGYLDANYEQRGSGQRAYQLTAGVRVTF
jgi:outer membrane autotransporter protein